MSVQFYEVSSSFHMVPHSPFVKKVTTINASSPVAIVPDVDINRIVHTKDTSFIGRQSQLIENYASPLPTGRVPSVSPRTPLNNHRQPREQQVPSQTPIRRKDKSLQAPPLDLFTDNDSIFL